VNPIRLRVFVLFAALSAAACIRLGIWQLHRRGERRAQNAVMADRLRGSERDASILGFTDTTGVRFRRLRVAGTPDYDHELILAARSHRGSPGVNLLTPVRIAGRDTAVLVNRGWVYAPDGATIDEQRFRERDSVFVGYADVYPSPTGRAYAGRPTVLARLGADAAARAIPYPVALFYVVALGDSTGGADKPARLTLPPLDEGPHLSYAIQWFSFATIAIAGAAFVIKQARDARPAVNACRPPVDASGESGGSG
jgi:surfeit locus 1 family protein